METTMTRAGFLKATAAGAVAASLGPVVMRERYAHAGPLPHGWYVVPGGTTLVNPVGTATTFDKGTGIIVQNDNVTIINPELREWLFGIDVRRNPSTGRVPRNLKVVFDPNARGYSTSGFHRIRCPVQVQRVDGLELGGVNGGMARWRECFKGVEILGGRNIDIHHFDLSGKFDWPRGREPGYKWGLKILPDVTKGPPYIIEHVTYRDGRLGEFTDEGLSADCRGNEPDKTPVRDTDIVKRINVKRDRVILASGNWSKAGRRYTGYWMVFITGKARGQMLRIASHREARFNLDDPAGVLKRVSPKDTVTIGMPTRNLTVENNTVGAAMGRIGSDAHGFVFDSTWQNNHYEAPNAFRYSSLGMAGRFGLRNNDRAFQAARVSSIVIGGSGSVTGNKKAVSCMGNTVRGNRAEGGDISFHTVQYSPNPVGWRYRNFASDNIVVGDAEEPNARLWTDEYNDLG